MPVKREPATEPSPTMAMLANHCGNVMWTKSPPCRMADTTIGPKINPPGKPALSASSATATDRPTMMTSSHGASTIATDPAGRRTGPASPNRPSPAGTHTARMMTRMVCTIAIARRSRPCSAASTMTCDSPPGIPPNTAVIVSQPCTRLRYATVPSVTAPIATVTAAMLSGQIVMPATVFGVATAPIDMPSTM